VDATAAAGWDNPTQANQRRIKAVRISIVARGARDNGPVTPGPLVLWDDPGTTNDRSMALNADQQRFRYQVLTVVVPLINEIWTGA
jgi:type IV pilus assembly protein PilW